LLPLAAECRIDLDLEPSHRALSQLLKNNAAYCFHALRQSKGYGNDTQPKSLKETFGYVSHDRGTTAKSSEDFHA